MTIYEALVSNASDMVRYKIYYENNIVESAGRGVDGLYKITLAFDETYFIGKGADFTEALKDAERQWIGYNASNPQGNPFARHWN